MIKTILLILLIPILSNCSLVGFGVGAIVDSANSKKYDRINSENQRINLVYTDGKKIKARYRGLIYSTKFVESENQLTLNNESSVKEIPFSNIGEKIEILDKEKNKVSGEFAGILKSNSQYQFILNSPYTQQNRIIPLTSIFEITFANGININDIPNPNQITLIYEVDDQIYRTPLNILEHINYNTTKSKFFFGSAGLAVDIIAVASCC